MLEFRAYEPKDRQACVILLRGNAPKFFARHERREFQTFLAHPGAYFVLTLDEVVVACGGYWLPDAETAHLTWGMVDATRHKQRLGERLLLERLRHIHARAPRAVVSLDTTQHSAGFFARYGFQTVGVTPNFYKRGAHRHDLRLEPDALAATLERFA
jgi:N-acetylglutamate synthase-like GNAT family acetyltransferase